jgi:ABC-type branched-subunit amino acid transport system permease subunit
MRMSGLTAGLATVSLLLIVRNVAQSADKVTGGSAGLAGVPVGAPRLVHRVELLRLPAAVADEPAERLAALLSATT